MASESCDSRDWPFKRCLICKNPIRKTRFPNHHIKCRRINAAIVAKMVVCLGNPTHLFHTEQEYFEHLPNCSQYLEILEDNLPDSCLIKGNVRAPTPVEHYIPDPEPEWKWDPEPLIPKDYRPTIGEAEMVRLRFEDKKIRSLLSSEVPPEWNIVKYENHD